MEGWNLKTRNRALASKKTVTSLSGFVLSCQAVTGTSRAIVSAWSSRANCVLCTLFLLVLIGEFPFIGIYFLRFIPALTL